MKAVVLHRGALGDAVLIWPALRALRAGRWDVLFVSDGEKARLTARELGVRAVDVEAAEFNALWSEGDAVEAEPGPSLVISTLAEQGSVWARRARERYPRAELVLVPGPLDRASALGLEARFGGPVMLETRQAGPGAAVVLHVGAGSMEKRWPMERWAEMLRAIDGPVSVIAGEVEAERLTKEERAVFAEIGGRYIARLDDLAEELKCAGLVVCADSGPGHLAAQMGRRVVSLFGPTDPARWAPIGPAVRVIAPQRPAPMGWLTVERVVEEVSPQRH
ncbi:MAG: glycosyltransferase family 9 protein [Phycisphaerales bacterium]|nr:glycosyltransferase family 9 protein [Phycisphaerales bacterium]